MDHHPEAVTTAGAVRGRREDGLAVFRGVPFARPPVGPLRFAAPEPPEPWEGVRPAEAFGPPPPQSPGPGPARPVATGDDWLTCNVWSPDLGAGGLPVMVWIYGGAYLSGSSGDPGYSGAVLAREGGVVVVTFNYRVAMEGFGQIQGAPANRGLLDQVAALTWVRDNIAAFGGDAGNVTVFGESAGAGSIAALLAMPRAAGLFRKAIAQSVPGTFLSLALADDIGAAIAAEAGGPPTVEALSALTPGRLLKAVEAVTATMPSRGRWGLVARTPTPFSPVVDGDVLPRTPWDALAAGAAHDVALIAGHNRDEYRFFLVLQELLGKVTDEQAAAALDAFAPDPAAFRAAFPDASADDLYETVLSDWLFRMPSLHLAEAQAAGGGRAHLYELAFPAPGLGGVFGACHVLDVPLAFGNLTGGPADLLIGDGRAAAEPVSAEIRRAWTRFATSGDPGWPVYDPDRRPTQIFDTEPAVTPYPEGTSRSLWASHTFPELPLLP
ncbi:carboxylesterase/lipase family protein [Actinomadura graeca]|uniref:Carboxylic ester hydrolase n=1 Tax=Actinomadura graeca TaxID=2750812 RepID=A0ABX8R9B6_9ACTN|nr:carboxylesterase family protein [Actinomadura graeca]QXJ25583.1 carboxylesterase/lipase family protein [Actinomadura graeca]